MTVLDPAPAPYLKPLPAGAPETNRPFFDGLRSTRVPGAEVRRLRRLQLGAVPGLPQPACRRSRPGRAVSGEATVYTYTVIYRGPGAFNADVPYVARPRRAGRAAAAHAWCWATWSAPTRTRTPGRHAHRDRLPGHPRRGHHDVALGSPLQLTARHKIQNLYLAERAVVSRPGRVPAPGWLDPTTISDVT